MGKGLAVEHQAPAGVDGFRRMSLTGKVSAVSCLPSDWMSHPWTAPDDAIPSDSPQPGTSPRIGFRNGEDSACADSTSALHSCCFYPAVRCVQLRAMATALGCAAYYPYAGRRSRFTATAPGFFLSSEATAR